MLISTLIGNTLESLRPYEQFRTLPNAHEEPLSLAITAFDCAKIHLHNAIYLNLQMHLVLQKINSGIYEDDTITSRRLVEKFHRKRAEARKEVSWAAWRVREGAMWCEETVRIVEEWESVEEGVGEEELQREVDKLWGRRSEDGGFQREMVLGEGKKD